MNLENLDPQEKVRIAEALIGIFRSVKGSYFEAMLGFYDLKQKEGANYRSCPYYRQAEELFFSEGQAARLIEKLLLFAEEFKQEKTEA
jgi:uncharacterized protein YhfF